MSSDVGDRHGGDCGGIGEHNIGNAAERGVQAGAVSTDPSGDGAFHGGDLLVHDAFLPCSVSRPDGPWLVLAMSAFLRGCG